MYESVITFAAGFHDGTVLPVVGPRSARRCDSCRRGSTSIARRLTRATPARTTTAALRATRGRCASQQAEAVEKFHPSSRLRLACRRRPTCTQWSGPRRSRLCWRRAVESDLVSGTSDETTRARLSCTPARPRRRWRATSSRRRGCRARACGTSRCACAGWPERTCPASRAARRAARRGDAAAHCVRF